MQKLIGIVLIAAFSSACAARGPSARGSSGGVISEASVRAHMEFLAGDALNGRGSGTRDEWIAVTYVAAQLRRWGLEPMGDAGGYVQTIEIERPELGAAPVLTMGGATYTHGRDFRMATMSAPSLSGTLATYSAGTPPAKGSVVVVPQVTRENSVELSAAAIILAGANGCGAARGQAEALPRVAPRTVGAPAATARPTCVALGDEAYAAAGKLTPGATVALEAPVKTVQKAYTWNAVGRLPGRDGARANEVILLSAHIDHVGTGPSTGSGRAPSTSSGRAPSTGSGQARGRTRSTTAPTTTRRAVSRCWSSPKRCRAGPARSARSSSRGSAARREAAPGRGTSPTSRSCPSTGSSPTCSSR